MSICKECGGLLSEFPVGDCTNPHVDESTIPTITAERLSEIEAGDLRTDAEHLEVCRLARLGLWAREHAIPALRFYSEVRHPIHQEYEFKTEKAHEALAALPAAEQKGDL